MRTNYLKKRNNSNTTTAGLLAVVLFFLVACSNDKTEKISAITDRASLPMFHSTEVTTLISDSGVTRYRITTSQWDDFDKANPPYWEFPCGIHFEKFNESLKVDANLHCQYAKFDKYRQLWELRGKVKATNLQGEVFETPQLFWDQRERKFYTDSVIKVTQISHIITGIGFDSDESMTRYHIRKPQGIFPVSDANTAAPTTPSPAGPTTNKLPATSPAKK